MDIFGTQKLEEQIAASKDPDTRKQLEELLEQRKNKAKKTMFFVLILLSSLWIPPLHLFILLF